MSNKHKELFERYKRDLSQETLDDLIVLKEPTDYNITEILKNRYKQNAIYVSAYLLLVTRYTDNMCRLTLEVHSLALIHTKRQITTLQKWLTTSTIKSLTV